MKEKIKSLDSDVEKKYKLFKAYTTHDSLVQKIEEFETKNVNLEKMLTNKDKSHFLKINAI